MLERQRDPPSAELWAVYRSEFMQMRASMDALRGQLADSKKAAAFKGDSGAEAGGGGDGAAAGARAPRAKNEFSPSTAAAASGGARAAALRMGAAGGKISLKAQRGAGAGAF